jgi:putative restriction endonuclease
VVTAYDHRCALCGTRVRTLEGHTAVDAAHIIPWSVNRDDRPANGLALCRTCHWAFDEGLLGISHEYEVTGSDLLWNVDNIPGYLEGLKGDMIAWPVDSAYWPSHESLGSAPWKRGWGPS